MLLQVTISYTGPRGATNRRLLVQYGFVQQANPSDRLDLGLMKDGSYIGTKPLQGNPCAAETVALHPPLCISAWLWLGALRRTYRVLLCRAQSRSCILRWFARPTHPPCTCCQWSQIDPVCNGHHRRRRRGHGDENR